MFVRFSYTVALAALAASCRLTAQTSKAVNVSLKETAGIRRNNYPVGVRIPFPKGALLSAVSARVVFNGAEVPAQYSTESQWPDGSVQWLAADFNATIGPGETQSYRLEYGNDVKHGSPPNGLVVTEDAETVQVGNVRFSRTGVPLLLSVKYRGESISRGANGFSITDTAGKPHDLIGSEPLKVEILKQGPVYVVLRYTSRMAIDTNYSVPFVITAEMPNSKSWIKVSATIEDPGKRLREIAYQTPLALGPFPWAWDFGTNHWTYGSFRNPTDSVILSQTVKATGINEWQVNLGPKGKEQPYEISGTTDRSQLARWGHIQDGNAVIAFAMDTGIRRAGTYRFILDGAGQTVFRFAPAVPTTQHQLTVYEHFVAPPVQIGAATSPDSMLTPLTVDVDPKQYVLSGMPALGNALDR
jgi:YetA-like protein